MMRRMFGVLSTEPNQNINKWSRFRFCVSWPPTTQHLDPLKGEWVPSEVELSCLTKVSAIVKSGDG